MISQHFLYFVYFLNSQTALFPLLLQVLFLTLCRVRNSANSRLSSSRFSTLDVRMVSSSVSESRVFCREVISSYGKRSSRLFVSLKIHKKLVFLNNDLLKFLWKSDLLTNPGIHFMCWRICKFHFFFYFATLFLLLCVCQTVFPAMSQFKNVPVYSIPVKAQFHHPFAWPEPAVVPP